MAERMASAHWQGKIIAEAETPIVFGFLRLSDDRSHYPRQGFAHDDDAVAIGNNLHDVAWFYPQGEGTAATIRGHGAAFWRRVEVQE